MGPQSESQNVDDLRRELGLMLKRLDALEDVIVLGDKVYMRVPSETATQHTEDKSKVLLEVKLALQPKKAQVGEQISLLIQLANLGNSSVYLTKIESFVPESFELIGKPSDCKLTDGRLSVEKRKIEPSKTEDIKLALRGLLDGPYEIRPKIVCTNELGQESTFEPQPVTIDLVQNTLPDRISTGFRELDSLLLGGIPTNRAVILTSSSCDERDFLVDRYLEAGIENKQITFYCNIDADDVKALAEDYQSTFYLFVCNPQADNIIADMPNVFKVKGVENLTDISIAFTSAFRKLKASIEEPRRACVGIVSDVLLQHHATQTRRWLAGVIPEFRSRGFTTLAIMNPYMHTKEEVQAVLDLFDGEISIYEKDSQRFLRIKKLHNERYLDIELPVKKAKPDVGGAATRGRWVKL